MTYIFPRLEAIRDDFESPNDIAAFLNEHLPHFTKNRMDRALNEMIEHMTKIIENGGCYV